MKTDLEILIDLLEAEVQFLKSALEQCISDWDFENAISFREPLIQTKKKLNVLRRLENPNFNRIIRLRQTISRLEESLNARNSQNVSTDNQTSLTTKEHLNKSLRGMIEESQSQLRELQSIIPGEKIDDDQILELLELMEQNELREIEIEIIKDQISLVLKVNDDYGEFIFKTSKNVELEHRIGINRSILRQLGYNIETYSKELPNFRSIDKVNIIEELSIVFFEVFGIFDKELKIRIR